MRNLKDNPVPNNVKESKVLDNYIKELLIENKKNAGINS